MSQSEKLRKELINKINKLPLEDIDFILRITDNLKEWKSIHTVLRYMGTNYENRRAG